MSDDIETRPKDSNADAWHLFLSEYLDARANIPRGMTFMAVQMAEGIGDAERRGPRRAILSELSADAPAESHAKLDECERSKNLSIEGGSPLDGLTNEELAKEISLALDYGSSHVYASRSVVPGLTRPDGMSEDMLRGAIKIIEEWELGPPETPATCLAIRLFNLYRLAFPADAPAQLTDEEMRQMTDCVEKVMSVMK